MFSKKAIWSVVLLITLASLTLSIPDTALAAEPHIVFAASRARIQRGECSRLEWEVKGGFVVLLNDQQVPRQGHLEVCPQQTKVFRLDVDLGDRMETRELAIVVEGAAPAPQPPAPKGPAGPSQPATIDFRADRTQLNAGECTTLRWDVENVREVYLDGQGVVGHSAQKVCPKASRTYELHVVLFGGTTERKVTIQVNGSAGTPKPSPKPGGKASADLAVTDLYPDKLPQGRVWVRVTNNGPAALTKARIELKCNAYGKPLKGGKPWSHVESPWVRTVSLKPGQTVKLKTNIALNTNKYLYDVTCAVSPPSKGATFSDPNWSNNNYSESIAAKPQSPPKKAVPFQAKVRVTDLFATKLRGGKLMARITNDGPGTLKSTRVRLVCQGAGWQGANPVGITGGGPRLLTLSPGQTEIVDTGIVINIDQYDYYEMACSVEAAFAPSNSYSERIP